MSQGPISDAFMKLLSNVESPISKVYLCSHSLAPLCIVVRFCPFWELFAGVLFGFWLRSGLARRQPCRGILQRTAVESTEHNQSQK